MKKKTEEPIKNLPFGCWDKQRTKENYQAYKTIDTASNKELPVFIPIGGVIICEQDKANKRLYKAAGRGQWSKKALKSIKESKAAMAIGELPTKKKDIFERIERLKNSPIEFAKEVFGVRLTPMQEDLLENLPRNKSVVSFSAGQRIGKTSMVAHLVEREMEDKLLRKYLERAEKNAKSDTYKVRVQGEFPASKPVMKIGKEFVPLGNINVQPGWNSLKPKRIPTRFNAKKLKEKHKDLWISIARQVALDMTTQKQIINSDKDRTCCEIGYLSLRFLETVSGNAAFTAIVEMIKRGLL